MSEIGKAVRSLSLTLTRDNYISDDEKVVIESMVDALRTIEKIRADRIRDDLEVRDASHAQG